MLHYMPPANHSPGKSIINSTTSHAKYTIKYSVKTKMQDQWGFSKHTEGAMDAVFLFAYAIGLYTSGMIGDTFDARYVQFIGLISTAIIIIIFASSAAYFNIKSDMYFIFIWMCNGLAQSMGWPTAVKLMGNWYGESHAGFIFGLWAANASAGNIIGAEYVSIVNDYNLDIQWCFYLPAIQLFIIAFLLLFFVRSEPSQWGINILDDQNQENESEAYEGLSDQSMSDGSHIHSFVPATAVNYYFVF